MIFAKQLQAARNAAGLSQSQTALAMGRSVKTLRNWEQGVNTPHTQIQALALAALKSAKRPKRKAENRQPIPWGRERPLNALTTTNQNENFDNRAVPIGIRHLFTVLDCDGCR